MLPSWRSIWSSCSRTSVPETKLNDFDLVTQADVASEQRLVACIREHFPLDGIAAEEGSQDASEASRTMASAKQIR